MYFRTVSARSLRTYIFSKYFNFTIGQSKEAFCWLFNFQARVLRKNLIASYDRSSKLYCINDRKILRYVASARVCATTYWKGFEFRATSLANSYFLNEIKFMDGDFIVDCGANNGDLAMYFQFSGTLVNYLGIEPSPPENHCLNLNIKTYKGESRILNIGLWKDKSIVDFYVSSDNADSSFIKPINFTTKVQVQAERLDNQLNRHIKLLKVEAEGGEPEVIFGCEKLLPKITYIAVDLGPERGPSRENTISSVTNYLLVNGFRIKECIAPSGRMTFLFENTLNYNFETLEPSIKL